VVQIAGQGNSAANVATIDLTTTPPAPLVSPTTSGGTPCDVLCQAEITKNGIKVMVSMPGEGSATQTINPQSIVQGVMLNGNWHRRSTRFSSRSSLARPTPKVCRRCRPFCKPFRCFLIDGRQGPVVQDSAHKHTA
jgi:hypothetical protein